MADLKEFADQLVNLSVKEVNELADILKEEYGIEPAAAAAPVAAAPAGGGDEGGGEAEQTEFNVILNDPGESKLGVVKIVKEVAGMGLKEAKAMVDETPATVKEGVSKEEADSIKEKLEDGGAQIDIQ
ncbi:MAG: 50S ribosomal protein L7/L12 [Bacteroidetes bacterium SW_11_45_7]|nr:MAG: 50S ribosomal protein L7/L12 [Bacteroidetes bacterium SW_11_45_7]